MNYIYSEAILIHIIRATDICDIQLASIQPILDGDWLTWYNTLFYNATQFCTANFQNSNYNGWVLLRHWIYITPQMEEWSGDTESLLYLDIARRNRNKIKAGILSQMIHSINFCRNIWH